jgi:hypothetical protein
MWLTCAAGPGSGMFTSLRHGSQLAVDVCIMIHVPAVGPPSAADLSGLGHNGLVHDARERPAGSSIDVNWPVQSEGWRWEALQRT